MSRVARTTGAASVLATVALAAALVPAPAVGAHGAVSSGSIQPMLVQLGVVSALPPNTADCQAALHLSCYSPRQLQAAYNLPAVYARKITGRGQTIVIVDAYGSPTLGRDVSAFDKAYHLPPPPTLKVITPVGRPPAFVKSAKRISWASETTLDVDYAHAVAPAAHILVVELPTDAGGAGGTDPVVAAETYVINHHLGSVISQSFGQAEASFHTTADLVARRGAFVSAAAHHITVLASSGDDGATAVHTSHALYLNRTVEWPASDPLVTAVGGTALHLDAAGARTAADTGWNDTASAVVQGYFGTPGKVLPFATGGGKSAVFGRPSYQKPVSAVVRSARGVPDISMSGACDGAVATYQSFPGVHAGWYPVCGSSESAPLFAGIVALADQAAGHALGLINPTLYALYKAHAPGLVDVTQGNTSVTFDQSGAKHTVLGTSAHAGYDMDSGVGTVDASKLVFELAGRG